jgi:hypothetical protein
VFYRINAMRNIADFSDGGERTMSRCFTLMKYKTGKKSPKR